MLLVDKSVIGRHICYW